MIQPPSIETTQKNKAKMMLQLLLMMFIDIGLPLLLYFVLSKYLSTILALIISGVPPAISVIVTFILRRQVNVIGLLVLIGFVVGIILSVIQGDPKLFLLRESFITGAIGLAFIITLIPIKVGSFEMRPLVYYNAKNLGMANLKGLTEDEPIPERWERYWKSYPRFRQTFIVLTAVWGFGLLLEVPVRVIIIYRTATIDEAVYIGNIFLYSWLGCLVLFTITYSKHRQKEGEKLLKEQEEAAASAAIKD
ncbi:membrane protein [Gigaspora margarita]|uniref:Membrane protein n=1 Tax=Gigaspora margarita TaxID=4874 RepID=A0A8H4B0K0_GIGMA|nr:membrane protein [Gigaspora margarita]